MTAVRIPLLNSARSARFHVQKRADCEAPYSQPRQRAPQSEQVAVGTWSNRGLNVLLDRVGDPAWRTETNPYGPPRAESRNDRLATRPA
jgi:hypothetical protein